MTDLRGSSTGRIKVRGATPYRVAASPALPPQEMAPGGDPSGQGRDSAPADGRDAREQSPNPDAALSGPREPQIEHDGAFEVPGPDVASPTLTSQESQFDGMGRAEISRSLFRASKIRALPRAERPRCNAKTRSGGRCQAQGLLNIHGKPGRCRLHGGLSSGAKTSEGLQRQREGAAKSAQKQWALARAEGRRTLKKNPTRDADSPDSKNAAPAAASDAAHTSTATRDRGRARHGQPMQVSAAADAPDSAVAAAPEATIDVMSLLSVHDIELPPKRDYVPLPERNRTGPRHKALAPAGDLNAALAEVAEKRRSGELEKGWAEADAIAREYQRRGGTLVDNAANRRILRELTRERRAAAKAGEG